MKNPTNPRCAPAPKSVAGWGWAHALAGRRQVYLSVAVISSIHSTMTKTQHPQTWLQPSGTRCLGFTSAHPKPPRDTPQNPAHLG